MKQSKRIDQIAALCQEIESGIMDIYCQPEAIENKIVFYMRSELPTDFLKELVDEKWWMKMYDRTFYLISLRNEKYLDIAIIKNDFPEDEKEKFLNQVYEIVKIDEKYNKGK